jgi:lysophospholipase L1-like esterase
MTVIYSSNFDSETSGQIATGWVAKSGTWAVGTSNPISGAQSFGSTTAVDQNTALYTGVAAQTYTKVQFTQKLPALSNAGHYSPILRMDSGYLNGYVWLIDFNYNAGKLTPRLYTRTNGSFPAPQVGATMSTVFAVGDIINVECISSGSTHEIRIWRSTDVKPTTATASFTESSFASGYVGLFRTGAGSVGTAVDDFSLDDGVVQAATAVTMTGPTSGTAGSASSVYTIGANGAITGTVTITPTPVTGITFTPTSVQISSASPTATFTATAASAGTYTIAVTNNGSLTNPASITYTASAADTTPPTFQSAVVANASPTVITVTMSETLAASTPPTSAFTVSGGKTVTAVGNPSGATFTLTVNSAYVSTDTITVSYTQPGANPRLQDAAGNLTASFGPSAVTNNVGATTVNALTNGTGNVLFSPYNWNVDANTAKTINPGAYFKTLFTGSSCTLQFDMTNIVSPVPQISYIVDGVGGWTTVNIAASVTIAVPSTTSMFNNKGGHVLEVVFKSSYLAGPRWSPQSTALVLTGIVLDSGATLTQATAKPLRALFFGDSITEGVRTMDGSYTNDMDRANSRIAWAYQAAQLLGAEVGIVGFGSQGLTNPGSGGVPALVDCYNLLYSGVSRSFASVPDFIAILHGTNDSGDVTTALTTVLNGLLSATPATTKIIVLRPFNGTHATDLQAGIAACTTPSRVTYVDTTGWFITADSADGLHPYGNVSMNRLGPMAATAIRSALNSAGVTTARTVTLTLGDTTGALANLTGLKVAAFDQPTPDLRGAPVYKSSTQTTDASGVLTFTMQSTLAAGGACGVSVQMADGRNFDVSATVA